MEEPHEMHDDALQQIFKDIELHSSAERKYFTDSVLITGHKSCIAKALLAFVDLKHNSTNSGAAKMLDCQPQGSNNLYITEYLWTYMEFFQLLDEIREQFEVQLIASPSQVRSQMWRMNIHGRSDKQVKAAIEKFVEVSQRLARIITEEVYEIPCGSLRTFRKHSPDVVVREERFLLCLTKGSCHVFRLIGPTDRMSFVRKKLNNLISKNLEKIPSAALMFTPCAKFNVRIYCGNIVQEAVTVIVCPTRESLVCDGGTAKAIAQAAGSELRWECETFRMSRGFLRVAQTISTTAGRLRPKIEHVIHVVGPFKLHGQCTLDSLLEDAFFNCLIYANDVLKATSIAIPAISTGLRGVDKEFCARRAYDALMKFDALFGEDQRAKYLSDIRFVNIDPEATTVFLRVFAERRASLHIDENNSVYSNSACSFSTILIRSGDDCEMSLPVETLPNIDTIDVRTDIIQDQFKHAERLSRSRKMLINGMRRIHCILDCLLEKSAVSREEYELIRSKSSTRGIIDCLVELLCEKSSQLYQYFLEALVETNQDHLYKFLEEKEYVLNMNHQKVLQNNYRFLKANIIISGTTLLDQLLETGVLHHNEISEIQCEKTPAEQVQKLLDCIFRTSSKQYQQFLDSIKNTNPEIADRLNKEGSTQ